VVLHRGRLELTKCQIIVLMQMLPLLVALWGTIYCRRKEREDREQRDVPRNR
jgi:hypothetical protein